MPHLRSLAEQLRNLRPSPPTESEDAAAAGLRAEVAALSALPRGDTPSEREWIQNRQMLRDDIKNKDPRRFLRWQVLQSTMVAAAPYITNHELPALRDAGWLPLLAEDRAGSPTIISDTSTSANLAHHAYHLLRFERVTGLLTGGFESVVEVGAGYGSMCRLLYRLSLGQIRATLFDLPEFSALQKYYLGRVGVAASFTQQAGDLGPTAGEGPRLLIATWSLSEMPVNTRQAIMDAVGNTDAYLFAFQDRFGEADNDANFGALVDAMPEIDWTLEPIDHIPGSRYLFGVRA